MPRILQLCEGLYASGQPVDLFVAPALSPVALDLFCKRSNFGENVSDPMSELDAQREVMLCMLLKVRIFDDYLFRFICNTNDNF